MVRFKCALEVTAREARLLVTHAAHGDLLKARLPLEPEHPRSLLTLLEGLSLWSGHRLCVALHAAEDYRPMPGSTVLGDALWPAESPLVGFEPAVLHDSRRVRLAGFGNFSMLRRLVEVEHD
jgi:hypothetical protein